MRNLPLKLTLTGSVAAFLVALPVSIDVNRSNLTAFGHASAISIGLKGDTAQATVGRERQAAWRASPGGCHAAVR